jgi:hypothetical protein
MPTITYDGRSFMLDSRRIWLVSGCIPYARIGRDAWRDRIHAAKHAGLNTIETPIFWNRHEPRPGKFDFKGDNDLRHFVDLVKKAGLFCILRVGPFVGEGWDMGGLPAWLLENQTLKLRTASSPFLEAASRFISAVADQLKGMQITSPGDGGPLVMVQVESNWPCGKHHLADNYLGELNRYLREAGLNVPVINSNNLWQSVEGEIDGWTGTEEMLAAMRQLAGVKPNQPRMVISFNAGADRVWGQAEPNVMDEWAVQRRLAEILAGGGQFNIRPFAGGTSTGFSTGRLGDGPASFVAPAADHGAMLTQAGSPRASYYAIRRIATFASRFSRVFANLDPAYQPVTIDPSDMHGEAQAPKKSKPAPGHGLSVVHAVGTQGSVAFVFDEDPHETDPKAPRPAVGRRFSLLLPDGSSLPVTLGRQNVAWCLFNTHINGRAVLDYCNLNAFASSGPMFVCFGPPGSRAVLSVNGSPIDVTVPTGKTPLVISHEGLIVVIVSEDEIDRAFVADNAVFTGVSGLTWDGQPIPIAGEKHFTRITPDGKVSKVSATPQSEAKPAEKVALAPWALATGEAYQGGTSPRYATIAGPADLTALGSPNGYGWYRVTLKNPAPRKAHIMLPHAGDRLHLFLDGEETGLVGLGPGAKDHATLNLKKQTQQLVILAENFGRFAGGGHMGEGKGLFGHIHEFEELKAAKPKLVRSTPVEVLAFRAPLWETRDGDTTLPERVTWSFPHRKKNPILVRFHNFPGRAILLLNDKPAAYVDGSGPLSYLFDNESLGRGGATIQLALFGDSAAQITLEEVEDSVSFVELTNPLSLKADFAFAKWEPPSASQFQPAKSGRAPGPAWWRTSFRVTTSHAPLFLDAAGLTKGQLYVNGHHVCRYFVADANAKPVPPQSRYFIPDAWLHHGRDNELLVFDEHGANPSKARLVYDLDQRPIRA